MPEPDAVRRTITEFFAERVDGRQPVEQLRDDFDVIVDGGLDSLGFLELLSRLEDEFDTELDLSEAPDGTSTHVASLVRAASG